MLLGSRLAIDASGTTHDYGITYYDDTSIGLIHFQGRPSLFSALKSPPDGSEDDGINNTEDSNSPNDTLPSLRGKS